MSLPFENGQGEENGGQQKLREHDGVILLSASDLMKFTSCRHATVLDIQYMNGDGPQPREASEDAALLQKHGDLHEAQYLEELKRSGKSVIEIQAAPLREASRHTAEILAQGADIVFQGAFLRGNWGGWSDFLVKVDKPSNLGDFSYEVIDTKLKRRPDPKHVLQLVLYSDLLAEIQGVAPEHAYLQLGDGSRATLRLEDYRYYARDVRKRLEAFVDAPEQTRPVPCSHCDLCRWGDHCASVWKAEDSLFNVASISRAQVKKFEAAGVTTMAQLAEFEGAVKGITDNVTEKLRTQALLQHRRKTGEPSYYLRAAEPGRGFDLLPEPQEGDLFYDIEGDPHYDGGLEYLHGVWFDGTFRAFWAHDHVAEAEALSQLFEFFRERLARYPKARIYHYAPYEITALRRLTIKYAIGEAFLDRLMRERRFVDLFAVVRGGVIASEPNYSIKSMEAFYGLAREGEVTTAGGSVVAYEEWLETKDQALLDEIEEYNKIDCISTQQLRDWLVSIRPNNPWPTFPQNEEEKEQIEDAEVSALRAKLRASVLAPKRQDALFNLGLFHNREAKPAQWAVFESAAKDEDELIDDLGALAGLSAVGPVTAIKRSLGRRYRFPPQETKLRKGKSATVPVIYGPPKSLSIEDLDLRKNEIVLKIGSAQRSLLADQLSLHPDWPIRTTAIEAAITEVIQDQCGARKYLAVDHLLSRRPPKLKGGNGRVVDGDDYVQGTIDAVRAMDHTVLPIQGPPGTGKTYVSARAIMTLVKDGARVGVTSNSHEAIRNVLLGCLSAHEQGDPSVSIIHKISGADDGYDDDCPIVRTTSNKVAAEGGDIVGGTAWFFSRQENAQAFDWLFVDEAGQVGLANMVAIGRAAKNIVLVGDPQQLPQVIQGSHPEPANLSCLQWVLGDDATIAPDRGIFLGTTRRMHPKLCDYISNRVYQGRLESHSDTRAQKVLATPYPEVGAHWVPVCHDANTQIAHEEVSAIVEACNKLVEGKWADKDGSVRSVSNSDIIVVAPYNAQVNALRERLPDGIRVGTVDKFQGQEAPICLVSMTASSADDTPRGIDFLFSLNRINVAVSRAKALALVFGNSALRKAKCDTVEQMKMVNTLCALPEWVTE